MRCQLEFDENKPLAEQMIKAYSAMQSTKEEPYYDEADIKDEKAKKFFYGYKCAMDDVCNILDDMLDFGEISQNEFEDIQMQMQGDICVMLWSILEDEYEEDDDED